MFHCLLYLYKKVFVCFFICKMTIMWLANKTISLSQSNVSKTADKELASPLFHAWSAGLLLRIWSYTFFKKTMKWIWTHGLNEGCAAVETLCNSGWYFIIKFQPGEALNKYLSLKNSSYQPRSSHCLSLLFHLSFSLSLSIPLCLSRASCLQTPVVLPPSSSSHSSSPPSLSPQSPTKQENDP